MSYGRSDFRVLVRDRYCVDLFLVKWRLVVPCTPPCLGYAQYLGGAFAPVITIPALLAHLKLMLTTYLQTLANSTAQAG